VFALTDDVVRQFSRLFRCRENTYGKYTPDPGGDPEKKQVVTAKAPVPDGMWRSHLEGYMPFLGSCPILQDNTCYWAAVDYDDDSVDHVALAKRIDDAGIPLLVCRSRSGAAHLFVFFSEPISAKLVIEKLREWVRALGIEKNPPDPKTGKIRDTEIFPKQDFLKPSEQGNWVNLPYWAYDQTDRYCVRPDGSQLSLEAFIALAESKRVSEMSLRAVKPKRSALPILSSDPFADGPPCLQTLHKDGWSEGSRNLSMFNIALFMRLAFEDEWRDKCIEFNTEHFNPPLSDGELELLLDSVERHPDYVYRCSDAPIESVWSLPGSNVPSKLLPNAPSLSRRTSEPSPAAASDRSCAM